MRKQGSRVSLNLRNWSWWIFFCCNWNERQNWPTTGYARGSCITSIQWYMYNNLTPHCLKQIHFNLLHGWQDLGTSTTILRNAWLLFRCNWNERWTWEFRTNPRRGMRETAVVMGRGWIITWFSAAAEIFSPWPKHFLRGVNIFSAAKTFSSRRKHFLRGENIFFEAKTFFSAAETFYPRQKHYHHGGNFVKNKLK